MGVVFLVKNFMKLRGENDFSKRIYYANSKSGTPPIETATTGYFMRQVSIGKDHHKDFEKLFNHTAGIAIISEDLPELHNRVELDFENKDSVWATRS